MLANHTGIASLFKKMLASYQKLRGRNAFLEGYKKEMAFRDGLGEFDEAREVVMGLVNEYEEAETEGYLSGGSGGGDDAEGGDARTDGVTGR